MAFQRRLISRRYPYLPVHFSLGHQSFQGDALLDTGFDGHLAVPLSFSTQIEAVPPDHYLLWELADGSTVRSPVYRSTVEMDGLGPFPAFATVLANEFLLGLAIIRSLRLTLDRGRRVIVQL